MTLEELVNSKLDKLNPTDLIVWRYIYAHKKECCYISIYDIADNCNVLVYEIKGSDEIGIILKNITENDLFIIISLSGESKKVVDVAQKLYLQKIPIISLTKLKSNTLATLSTENIYVTPIDLPATVDFEYKSMLGFFLVVEMWFVSYSQYCAEQIE